MHGENRKLNTEIIICCILVTGNVYSSLKESYKTLCDLHETESKFGVNFQSDTKIYYYLNYWLPVLVIRPSSGHLYIKFDTGYM